MARIYKVEGYIVDKYNNINEDDIKRVLRANAPEESSTFGRFEIEKSDKFDWIGDLDLAVKECDKDDFKLLMESYLEAANI